MLNRSGLWDSAALGAVAVLREVLEPLLFGPAWFVRKIALVVPLARVRRLREIGDTLEHRSRQIIQGKRAALASEAGAEEVGAGRDIMSILCEWACARCVRLSLMSRHVVRGNSAAAEKERLTDEEVIAQIS